MPNTLLTAFIHGPDFGSCMEKPAMAQKGTPMPAA
jgi:hypothetical protein